MNNRDFKKYEIGIPEIDAQHHALIDSLEIIAANPGQEDLIESFYVQLQHHELCEEALMQKFDYPDLLIHMRVHEAAGEGVGLIRKWENVQTTLDHLEYHIKTFDLPFSAFYHQIIEQ